MEGLTAPTWHLPEGLLQSPPRMGSLGEETEAAQDPDPSPNLSCHWASRTLPCQECWPLSHPTLASLASLPRAPSPGLGFWAWGGRRCRQWSSSCEPQASLLPPTGEGLLRERVHLGSGQTGASAAVGSAVCCSLSQCFQASG